MQVQSESPPDPRQLAIGEMEKAERRLKKAAQSLRAAKAQASEAGLLSEEVADVLARVRAERAELEVSALRR